MDFAPTEAQTELAALARQILADLVSQDRLRKIEEGPERFDPELWAALAQAGVLAAALPESVGGSGLGVLEQCSVLVELGRAVAPVPYLDAIMVAASALAHFGNDEQRRRWATPAAEGRLLLTAALGDGVTARQDGDRWTLSGTVDAVSAAAVADLILVPAGPAVFLVAPDDPGVTVRRQSLVDLATAAQLELDDVALPADRLLGEGPAGGEGPRVGEGQAVGEGPRVGEGPAVGAWLVKRSTIGLCALQLGICERALELTAEYARERVQFGRPIGAFQAVSQRLADAYIDVEAIRLTLWQAAWKLATDQPCDAEIATAKFWAADAGHRVAHTAVHVHGGVGIDTDHPLHRYFIAAKRAEFAQGGATEQLARLGHLLAQA